jgi:hypothetical protein
MVPQVFRKTEPNPMTPMRKNVSVSPEGTRTAERKTTAYTEPAAVRI